MNIFPKLPVHIRQYREAFQRNRRIEEMNERAANGREALNKLNSALKNTPSSKPAVSMPVSLPTVQQAAMKESSNEVVGGVCTSDLPESKAVSKGKGERGCDRKQRRKRQCAMCKQHNPEYADKCQGRSGRGICDLYDASGARRCGRCARANRKDASKGTSAAQCTAATCSLEHWSADLCQFYSDDIGTPRAMYSVK